MAVYGTTELLWVNSTHVIRIDQRFDNQREEWDSIGPVVNYNAAKNGPPHKK